MEVQTRIGGAVFSLLNVIHVATLRCDMFHRNFQHVRSELPPTLLTLIGLQVSKAVCVPNLEQCSTHWWLARCMALSVDSRQPTLCTSLWKANNVRWRQIWWLARSMALLCNSLQLNMGLLMRFIQAIIICRKSLIQTLSDLTLPKGYLGPEQYTCGFILHTTPSRPGQLTQKHCTHIAYWNFYHYS